MKNVSARFCGRYSRLRGRVRVRKAGRGSVCIGACVDSQYYAQIINKPKVRLTTRELHIPANRIIRVPSLIFVSFAQVIFDGEDSGALDISESRLRELKLVSCRFMTPAHLRRTVDSLVSLGIWDVIERVVVQRCERLTYKDVLDIVGRERLRYIF